jgi:hypothetical protein
LNTNTKETLITGSWEEDPVSFCKDLVAGRYDPDGRTVSVDTTTGRPYIVATTQTEDLVCGWVNAQWILSIILFKWRAYKNRRGEYAYLLTNVKRTGGKYSPLSLHRFIYLLSRPELPDLSVVIDHADRNPLNNREENLRALPRLLNLHNSDHFKPGSSAFPGVKFNEKSRIWEAVITVGGERKLIGEYDSEREAANGVLDALMEEYPAADWTDQVKEEFFPGVQ